MSAPRFSVCEITTLPSTFEQDLEVYRAGGVEGIGICEFKLPADGNDAGALAGLRASGLTATLCVPAVLSVLPLPLLPGPGDPARRVDAICTSLRRLAAFDPVACVCLTGPPGALPEREARRIVVEGLRTIGRVGASVNVRVALEPIHPSIRDDWSLVSTVPEAVELLTEVDDPGLGLIFDVWHLGDSPAVLAQLRTHAARCFGVHINDRRQLTRSWKDRVLPGDGVLDLSAILGALEAGGYRGWYDLEVFSDNGSFGDDYPDSLWKQDPSGVVQRGRTGFLQAWEARKALLRPAGKGV